jgi:hypothetical protein
MSDTDDEIPDLTPREGIEITLAMLYASRCIDAMKRRRFSDDDATLLLFKAFRQSMNELLNSQMSPDDREVIADICAILLTKADDLIGKLPSVQESEGKETGDT